MFGELINTFLYYFHVYPYICNNQGILKYIVDRVLFLVFYLYFVKIDLQR